MEPTTPGFWGKPASLFMPSSGTVGGGAGGTVCACALLGIFFRSLVTLCSLQTGVQRPAGDGGGAGWLAWKLLSGMGGGVRHQVKAHYNLDTN